MPPKKGKNQFRVEPSVSMAMEALIRAEQDVCYAQSMTRSSSPDYATALGAIRKLQDTYLKEDHPERMTKKQKAELYPALAERLGIHRLDQ